MPGISMKEDMEGAGRVSTAIGENGTHGLEICTSRRVYCQLGLWDNA